MAHIKPGLILYSLSAPYLRGELDLEGVIRTAAEMGAEGYEIVASQMIPSYPFVSDEFLGFVEMCKGKYIVTEFEDIGMYDTFEQTTRHIAMMKKLITECA